MLERKQVLTALLQLASASVEYKKNRVCHPLHSHYHREDMQHPLLLSVVAQAFRQRLVRLLLSYGCRKKLGLMYFGGTTQNDNHQ
jgi:hypothetical protein